MGSYYVQEISTNSAYLVSDEKYPVDFEYAGQETAVVNITANEGEAIENELIYGSVSGKKSNEDGEDLGGAFIGIFQTGTTEYTKENAIATATSEDDGSFSFDKVPYGICNSGGCYAGKWQGLCSGRVSQGAGALCDLGLL